MLETQRAWPENANLVIFGTGHGVMLSYRQELDGLMVKE